jgi:hypothetical protein
VQIRGEGFGQPCFGFFWSLVLVGGEIGAGL